MSKEISFTTEVRVGYAQVDQMGIAHNAKYLEYFEIGRTELLRNLGLSYREVERKGILLPLVESYIKYIKQAKYDDILNIKAYLVETPKSKLTVNYNIFVENNLICEGYTVHAFVKKENFRVTRVPDFLLKIMSVE